MIVNFAWVLETKCLLFHMNFLMTFMAYSAVLQRSHWPFTSAQRFSVYEKDDFAKNSNILEPARMSPFLQVSFLVSAIARAVP